MGLSDGWAEAFAAKAKVLDPFELIDGGHLYIRTMQRGGMKLIPFTPDTMTPPQKRLYRRVKELYYSNQPVRLRILKARQMGFSTLCQAIIFSFSVVKPYMNSLVLSYRAKSATWLFDMQKLFQEQIEKRGSYEIEPLVKSNEKKMEWRSTHSIVGIDTEGSPNVALTETRNIALLTEYAYYSDPVTLWDNLSPSIPLQPGTMIFIETTANGVGNQFYQEWKSGERGQGGFENFFFPWTEHPMYVMPKENLERFEPTDDDLVYRERYELSDEQFAWYLMQLHDNFRGDREAMAEKYPASAEEAFRSPGGIVFKSLANLLLKTEAKLTDGTRGRMEKTRDGFSFKVGPGPVEIFRHPVFDRDYVAYSDCGEGLKGGEIIEDGEKVDTTYSTVIVRDALTSELCAIMECRYPIDVFADDAEMLCRYYNQALWGVEIPGPGFGVIGRMTGRYENLYRSEWIDADNHYRKASEYGYRNSVKTKPVLESDWEAFIRDSPDLIGSRRILGQALTYIVDPKSGKHIPKPGCFSDLLLADFGAIQMLKSKQRRGISRDTINALRDYNEKLSKRRAQTWSYV